LPQSFIAGLADFAQALGVRPSQAAKCLAEAKFAGSTVSAMVIAPSGPTPGISANAWLSGLALCSAANSASTAATRLSSVSICAAICSNIARAVAGIMASAASAISRAATLAVPFAATTPN
jgi:hypothetical protein